MEREIKEKAVKYLKEQRRWDFERPISEYAIIRVMTNFAESLNEEKEVIAEDKSETRKQISDLVVIAVVDSNKLTEVIDKIVELKK